MQNIPALTSVRFLAALAVFFHHYLYLAAGHRHFGAAGDRHPLFQLMWEGRFGVTLFFVLSGFLLTARYYECLHRKVGFRIYWVKRFARIMPLYWIICLGVFFSYILRGYDLEPFIVFFTLTQAFFSDLKFHGVETAWSLTVEETFYLTLPFLIVFIRRSWRDRWPLWVNLGVTGAILLAVTVVYYQLGRQLQRQELFTAWGFFRDASDWRTYTICGRFYDFAIGVFVGMYYMKSRNIWLSRRWIPDLVIAVCTIAILVVCYLIWQVKPYGGLEEEAGNQLNMVNATLSALVIYFLCSDTSRIARWMSWSLFVYLGQISYAFYLVHKLVFTNWLYRVFAEYNVSFLVAAVWLYLIISLMSAFCYEVVERPCQYLILRWTGAGSGRSGPPGFLRWLGEVSSRRLPGRAASGTSTSPARQEA